MEGEFMSINNAEMTRKAEDVPSFIKQCKYMYFIVIILQQMWNSINLSYSSLLCFFGSYKFVHTSK